MSNQVIYILLAIILAFFFQPIRRQIEKLTDRYIFRDRYNSQTVLSKLAHILTSEQLQDRLLNAFLRQIFQSIKVTFGCFVILDEAGRVYQTVHVGRLPAKFLESFDFGSLGSTLIITDKLDSKSRKWELLDRYRVGLAVPLKFHERSFGYLILGHKRSGSTYSTQDLQLLEVITPELAVAINNAEAYAQIEDFNASLRQKIQDATAKLRNANRDLRGLDKAKDEFLSIASHQLRTPLAAIEAYLSMMEHGDVGKMTAEQQKFTSGALERSHHMARLISELLDLSSFSKGKVALNLRPVDLEALVTKEVEGLVSLAEAKGLKLTFTPPTAPLPQLNLDEAKTRQIVTNMIDNAIFYTEVGSVNVALVKDDHKLRFVVTDTGIGVPEAEKAKVFSRFFRASNARLVRPDGTGIGMYLASSVLKQEGGTIVFESKQNQGSVFGFELPIKGEI